MEFHNATVPAASSDDSVTIVSGDDTEMPEQTATAHPAASPAPPKELTIIPPAWGYQHLGHLEGLLGILCFIAPETIPEDLYAELLPSRLCYATDVQEFAFSIRSDIIALQQASGTGQSLIHSIDTEKPHPTWSTAS